MVILGVQSTKYYHILTVWRGDVFYLYFICCIVFRKKALSEIFLMALLPSWSWRELEEINNKCRDGKLKEQKPSLSEVLSTPSIKQIHLRCLSGLTPEERYQLLAQASPLLSCNQISFHLPFFSRIFLIFLRINISEKSLTQRFNVAMTSLSSDNKDKTRNWLNIYGLKWQSDMTWHRGFIKVLNRRATEFNNREKNWQGPPGLAF